MLSTSDSMEKKTWFYPAHMTETHILHSFGSTQRTFLAQMSIDDRIFSTVSQEAAEEGAHYLKEIRISE